MSLIDRRLRGMDGFRYDSYREEIRERVYKNLDIIDGNYEPVLVHQDFSPDNIIVKN